ncbi:MAG: HNH endonuclease [Hyphomicrobiales bacterium]
MVKAYVGVTDVDWYRYLAAQPSLHEANFWRPYGAGVFKVLESGEPFIFKAKAPLNRIVGGGIFEGFVSLSISRAWEFFGEGNGVSSPEALVERIRSITSESLEEIGDRDIGCILLRDIWFLPEGELLPAPATFSGNIVQGKSYEYPGGDAVVDAVAQRIFSHEEWSTGWNQNVENLGPTKGEPRLMTPRLGQAGFKAVVQEAYSRRCAVTRHKILPTLQAAHVIPIAQGGQHRVDNGILLRSDVHTLFDQGYIGFDEEFRLRVSSRLRSEYGNGDEFYSREGEAIDVPSVERQRPSAEFLSWHLELVFR